MMLKGPPSNQNWIQQYFDAPLNHPYSEAELMSLIRERCSQQPGCVSAEPAGLEWWLGWCVVLQAHASGADRLTLRLSDGSGFRERFDRASRCIEVSVIGPGLYTVSKRDSPLN